MCQVFWAGLWDNGKGWPCCFVEADSEVHEKRHVGTNSDSSIKNQALVMLETKRELTRQG